MKHLEHSKWTAVKKIKNWRHYEVLNINKKAEIVEMFSVCAKKIRIEVPFEDLRDNSKWMRILNFLCDIIFKIFFNAFLSFFNGNFFSN